MKIYSVFILIQIMLFAANSKAQSVSYSLGNPEIIPVGVDTFYEVDVMIASQVPEDSFLLSSGQLYFNYNSDAFGLAVAGLGSLNIFFDAPSYLLNLKETNFGLLNIYALLPTNDNTPSRVSIAWRQDRAGNCISKRVTFTPQPLLRLRLKYLAGQSLTPPDICFESMELFANQAYTACGPFAGPCNATVGANCTSFPGMQIFNDVFSCNLVCGASGISSSSAVSVSNCSEGSNGWVHLTNNMGEVVLSVNPNGNNLGTIIGETYIDPVTNTFNGDAYMQRHYRLNSTLPVSGPVTVRLFFTNQEFDNLVATALSTSNPFDNLASISQLAVTKYSGPSEDGVYDPSDATSMDLLIPAAFGIQFGANFLEVTVNSFSEFWLHGGNSGLLPVELLTFSGRIIEDGVSLKWITGTETNTDYFEVERSGNAVQFNSLGKVQAAGWSDEENQYSFIDRNPALGKNYYRLRIMDADGRHEFSKIISFDFDRVVTQGIYPNPTTGDLLEFSMISESDGSLKYQILDASGKIAGLGSMPVQAGQQHYKLNIGHLAAGIYILRLDGSGNHQAWRFLKIETE